MMNNKDDNAKKNDGLRKAAILVAGLDRHTADEMLDQMTDEQAQAVRRMIVDLGEIDPGEQRRVIDEFFRIGPLVPEKDPPGIELDVRPRREEIPLRESTKPFQSLGETEADRLARVLADERPQTVALVLAHLPPERAGGVLARLSEADQVEVVHRLVDMEETDPEVLRDVERAIQTRLARQVPMQRRRVAGLQAVHGILEASGGQVGTRILDTLAARDESLAERLAPTPVAFDDLMQLSDSDFGTVFDEAGPDLTLTALIDATPGLVHRVLRQFPPKEAEAIRRRLDHPGAIRLSDMDDARQRIAEIAGRLAVEGRIELETQEATKEDPMLGRSLSYAA